MHGNVWEWCLDSPRTYKLNEKVSDPVGESHKSRTIRGGGWYDKAWDGRSSNRGTSLRTGVSENDLGFRVIRIAVPVK
jgi:formylglycine-generating enzyme required for sulfatase activity